MDRELISIIIPLYNAEKYIDRCITSIIAQTYKNLQIILIDDGSIDETKNICEQWKEKDSRIMYIYKENGGVSSARNIGLQHAKGTYIMFVDQDDEINRAMVERLYIDIETHSVDLSMCNCILKYDFKDERLIWNNNKHVFDKEYFYTHIFDDNGYKGYMCNKMLRNSIIKENNLKFDEKIHKRRFIIYL